MSEGKFELFMISFITVLIVVPLMDYLYDMLGPKLGLPTL